MGFSYPVPKCVDCGELIPDAKRPGRLRCRACSFKDHKRRLKIYHAQYQARRKEARS